MKEKIIGIVVFLNRAGEDNFFIGILSDSSIYKKAWLIKRGFDKIYIGLRVFGNFYVKNNFAYFVVEGCEEFLGTLFWQDGQKLIYLTQIINRFKGVPENIKIINLYEKFVESLKMISRDEKNCDEFFKKEIDKLIN